MSKKCLPAIFLALLVYFVFSSAWYEPARLEVTGKAENGTVFEIQWDSGAGFNTYETKRFHLNTRYSDGATTVPVVVRHLGDKHFASLSTDIVCKAIRVDGKTIDFASIKLEEGGQVTGDGILLNTAGSRLSIDVKPESVIEIEMLTNNHSGKVELAAGDTVIALDLYMANVEANKINTPFWVMGRGGEFKASLDVPRYDIDTFRLRSVGKNSKLRLTSIVFDGDHYIELDSRENMEAGTHVFTLRDVRKLSYLHPVQCSFQVCFALLTTWMIWGFSSFVGKVGGIRGLFSGRRKLFWGLFGGAALAYFFWLAVFWPGVMSVDSLKIWRSALLPEVFINDHPLFNVILYMYLAQFWQNPVVVPIFHIVMMALLIAHIFYSIAKQGVAVKWLLPFYLLLVTSLPIGLYNIVLWKDIPFAMLIVFWAYTIADLWRKKQAGCYTMSYQKFFALTLLLLALALTRHNGLVYLAVVPLYFVALGLVTWRRFFVGVAGGGLLLSLAVLAMYNSPMVSDANYLWIQVRSYLQTMFNTSLWNLISRAFHAYWGILDITQTATKWDLWHYFLADRRAYWFLTHSGWSDIFPYLPESKTFMSGLKEIVLQLYHKTYETPWVYTTWNPLYVLFVLPLTLLLYKKVPQTAIFSSVILVQVFVLVFVIGIMNWRYYYFVFLGGMFLGPLLLSDLKSKKKVLHTQ